VPGRVHEPNAGERLRVDLLRDETISLAGEQGPGVGTKVRVDLLRYETIRLAGEQDPGVGTKVRVDLPRDETIRLAGEQGPGAGTPPPRRGHETSRRPTSIRDNHADGKRGPDTGIKLSLGLPRLLETRRSGWRETVRTS
jgi:hypothetical protein